MTKDAKKIQVSLLGEISPIKEINKIEDHWINMPEYNNTVRVDPMFVAIFKFRNKKDFKQFNELIKKYIFDDKLNYGSIKRNVKVIWYPPFENTRTTRYVYIDEKDDG